MNAILVKNTNSNLHVLFPAHGKPVVCGPSQSEAISRANKLKLKLVNVGSKAGTEIATKHKISA